MKSDAISDRSNSTALCQQRHNFRCWKTVSKLLHALCAMCFGSRPHKGTDDVSRCPWCKVQPISPGSKNQISRGLVHRGYRQDNGQVPKNDSIPAEITKRDGFRPPWCETRGFGPSPLSPSVGIRPRISQALAGQGGSGLWVCQCILRRSIRQVKVSSV